MYHDDDDDDGDFPAQDFLVRQGRKRKKEKKEGVSKGVIGTSMSLRGPVVAVVVMGMVVVGRCWCRT